MANEVDWPLAPPLATLGTSWGEPPDYRCGLIEGEDVDICVHCSTGQRS